MTEANKDCLLCTNRSSAAANHFVNLIVLSIPKMYNYKSSNIPDWRSLLHGPLEDEEAPRVLLDGISSLPLLAFQLFDGGYDLVGLLKRVLHRHGRQQTEDRDQCAVLR